MLSRFSTLPSALVSAASFLLAAPMWAQSPTPTPASAPLWSVRANAPAAALQDNFGQSLVGGQTTFDFNLDGSGDLIAGAPNDRNPLNPNSATGSIAVLDGRSGAELQVVDLTSSSNNPSRLYGDTPNSSFGFAVAERLSGGYHDVIVGAPGSTGGLPGYVKLFTLVPAGSYAYSVPVTFGQNNRVTGLAANDQYGRSLAFGDFLAAPGVEIAVGAPQKSPATPTTTDNRSGYVQILSISGQVLATLRGSGGGMPGDGFGYAIKNVLDQNGDGYDELAVGAPYAAASVGRVEVISFSPAPNSSGMYSAGVLNTLNGPPASGSTTGSLFGTAIETLHSNMASAVPNLVLIGAPRGQTAQSPAQTGTVAAYSLSGSPGPLFTISNGLTADKFGQSIRAAGDLNLDGAEDFIVGAPGADNGGSNEAGTAAIFSSRITSTGTVLPPTLRFVADNSTANENLGASLLNLQRQSPNNGAVLDTLISGGPIISGLTPGFVRAYQNVGRPSVQRQLGAGCPRVGSALDLELTVSGATVGNTLTIVVRNAVPGQSVFLWASYPPASSFQLPLNNRGCNAYLNPAIVQASIVGTADAQGVFTYTQQLLNSTTIIGATAHLQAFQIAASTTPLSFDHITASNGLAVTAGATE